MTTPFMLILAVFASYRLAAMVAREEGPYGVFLKLRTFGGSYDYDEQGNITSLLGRGLACPLCVGVYWACLCACAVTWRTVAGDFLILWMGIAGAQALLTELVAHDGVRRV